MSADEKLRDILRAEADLIEPSPAGWDRIREVIAVRRRRRLWLRSSLVATTALSLVAVVALVSTGGTDPDTRGRIVPATAPPSPSASPGAVPAPADRDAPLPVIWPLTTLRQIDFWQDNPQSRPALRSPETTAKEFVLRYLGLADVRVESSGVTSGTSFWVVSRLIVPGDEKTRVFIATVAVTAEYARDDPEPGPYLVSRVESGDGVESLTITSLTGGDSPLMSPVTVTGRVNGVDESVRVEIRGHQPAGAAGYVELAKAFVPAGAEQPWETVLSFPEPPENAGAVYASTASPADGKLSAVTVIPVALTSPRMQDAAARTATPQPTAASEIYPAQFVAVEDGRIGVYEAKTGKRVRFYTEPRPGGGASEPSVYENYSSILYVQGEGTCASSIRSVGLDGFPRETLVTSKEGRVASKPAMSDGGRLAYASSVCDPAAGATELVVGSKRIRFGTEEGGSINDLAWSPKGDRIAVLVGLIDSTEIYLVDPDTASSVVQGKPLPRPPDEEGVDCDWSSVTFAGDGRLLAGQACWSEISDAGSLGGRIVAFEESGPRPFLTLPERIAAFDVDRSGDHLVLGMLACDETCEHAPESVERFSVDGDPVKVTEGLTQPVWVD